MKYFSNAETAALDDALRPKISWKKEMHDFHIFTIVRYSHFMEHNE